ncbi:MAG TPA: PAS domain S-box protein [Desulfobacterales bacterium]|nr:PAS domain S-box protein [Desulfobacterales bacterium]
MKERGFMTQIHEKSRPRQWINLPPWLILGAVAVLAPIFIFMTLEYLDRQNKKTTELLVEKGAALIRSFEAGTRTGMLGMNWGRHQIQRLLSETSKQPDIIHLIITDSNGLILAHSDLDQVGTIYKTGLELSQLAEEETVKWREISGPNGLKVFEVYRKFEPVRRNFGRMGMWKRMGPMWRGLVPETDNRDLVIFVGLDMTPVEIARREDTFHMIIMAFILLLIGFAGIVSLFLAQAYRGVRVELSKVQAFSDNLVKNMPAGLVAVDNRGFIIAFNNEAEKILEVKESYILGKKFKDYLPPEIYKAILEAKEGSGPVEREGTVILEDGKEIPLHITATLLKEEGGDLMGIVALIRDLTQIKQLENEVARSQRLAAIGRLAAGVAHEIRNPLSSIKGFATYFREKCHHIPEGRSTAEVMIQEVERLNRVIGQLLDFARPDTVLKRPVDIQKLLQDSIRMVQQDAEKKGVTIELDSSHLEVSLDPDRVKQALLNLYLNALDAMDSGGTMRVESSYDEKKEALLITVSDTGQGIKEQDLPHVFDPYFTTKSSGTGLGLSIVLKIVEAHKGKLNIESNYGKGTTVSLVFPIKEDTQKESRDALHQDNSHS